MWLTVRNIRTAVAKTNNINDLEDFVKSQNMHKYAFRYKLDTSDKAKNY